MPLRLSEGADALPGYIQAFDVRTGELRWVFKTIPHPGEAGYETWPPEAYRDSTVGAANNWAGMAVDVKRAMLYVPTGSAAFDFYGANRKGSNLFANTLLALNARTGKRVWHYQLVHHDILDRDAPAPPNLVTVRHNGSSVDAVAQITKQGFIFLFNRENGEPLFPINEVAVPPSDVPGEEAWPTQPMPVKPAPFARQKLSADDINPLAPNKDELVARLKQARSEGPFTPLSLKGTIIFPGLDGGAEWGGAAVDDNGVMYVNSNEMPWLISLQEESAKLAITQNGQHLYTTYCASCHGTDRTGNLNAGFPSLINPQSRWSRNHVNKVLASGKGMMPAFTSLSKQQRKTLIGYLYGDEVVLNQMDKKEVGATQQSATAKTQYRISGYTKFLDQDGHPAIRPPWGTLSAVDLNSGEYLWQIPYGEIPALMEKGLPITGAESYGGPIVTAGGLLFIAGTKDQKMRAYHKRTGRLLWETKLPAAAFATPSTYEVNGKQYVVIACGGTKLGAAKGDSYVAFALP